MEDALFRSEIRALSKTRRPCLAEHQIVPIGRLVEHFRQNMGDVGHHDKPSL